MTDTARIHSPIASGSGVIVVHRTLEANLPDYQVEPLSPYWAFMPPALRLRPSQPCAITHSQPELGAGVAHPDSKLVTTFHNYYLDKETAGASSRAQNVYYQCVMSPAVNASLKRAQWVTAVSYFTADLVQRNHALGERLVVIPNGVDTRLFSPTIRSGQGPVRILFSGNPIKRKGSHHLAALSEALPAGAIMHYTVGMRDSAVEHLVSTKKLLAIPRRPHVQMPALYADTDILFFPTLREGLSLVTLEAMACGLPVVATRCSSMPELVEHGKGGYLFEENNRGQMLDYLTRLVRNPTLRAEMGSFNREKVLANFGLRRMIAGYRELFAACGH